MWNKSYRISYLVPSSLRVKTFHRHNLLLLVLLFTERAVWAVRNIHCQRTQVCILLGFDYRCYNRQVQQDPPLAQFVDCGKSSNKVAHNDNFT